MAKRKRIYGSLPSTEMNYYGPIVSDVLIDGKAYVVKHDGSYEPPAPTPPTPTKSPMYLEAAQANSTVSMVSTLATAPNLEYSLDGETWQEWQHTTADNTHTFDVITLGAIGDRVYFRGDNPQGLGYTDGEDIWQSSTFVLTGAINAGGNVMSLLDTTMELTEVPDNGLSLLFCDLTYGDTPVPLLTTPDMGSVTTIGNYGCASMYSGCTSLTAAADMPSLTTIGEGGCVSMYRRCAFDMSNDGSTLNFAFPTPPVTAGEITLATAYDIADWMGNTNGLGSGR